MNYEIEQSKYEVKLNSEYVDTVKFDELTELNKLILQTFDSVEDSNNIYITLNDTQVVMNIHELKSCVDFLVGK